MSETRQLICFLLLVWIAIWMPVTAIVTESHRLFGSVESLADLDRQFIQHCVALPEAH